MDQIRNDVPRDQGGAIQISLWLDGSMPAGIATGPDGNARDFTGWVGLMSAVDALVAGGAKPDGLGGRAVSDRAR
jgi:hypothetical protein